MFARSSDADMHVGVLTAVCWLWTWLQEELYVQGEALGLDEETVRDAVEAFDGDYAVRHTATPIGICRSSRRDDEPISRKSCFFSNRWWKLDDAELVFCAVSVQAVREYFERHGTELAKQLALADAADPSAIDVNASVNESLE